LLLGGIRVSIGQALSDARQKSGLSVEQVAAATRVRQTVIKAIEQDDFTLCGGDFYARGHIRNIARTVGTDPTPLLSEFDSGHDVPDNSPTKTIYESEARQVRLRRGPNWSAAMAAALVLILGFGIYRVVTASPSGSDGDTATQQSTGQPSAAAPTTAAPKPRPSSSAVAQAPRGVVTVVVTGTGSAKSWVSVRTGAGRQLFQGLVAGGQTRTFTDVKLLRFTIGNAGAVELIVNGKSIGHPGPLGKVVRAEFGPTDPATG
jgi:cytoskeleton protein RodZ